MLLRRVFPLIFLGVALLAQEGSTVVSPSETTARAILSSLSLRDRVAQLIVAVSNGDAPARQSEDFEKYHHLVADLHVGGLMVNNTVEFGSARNANPHTMAVFLNQMQKLSSLPLLVSSDFEQSASFRITGGAKFPQSMGLAAGGDVEAARYEGQVTAREARALGIHWVFAPVADVNNNPANPIINLRSYGEDPEQVSRFVTAFIEGAHSDPANQVLVTAKHFPGHGDTAVDSHLGLPKLTLSRDRMDAIELKPFRAAIASGVDSIMTAHMALPELDPSGVPATVSPKILTDLLRNELQFKNLIVTDAMTMQGLASLFNSGEGSVRSLLAGADILLMPPDPEMAINAVVEAVEQGRLTEERLDQSVLRLLTAKVRLGLMERKTVDLEAISDVLAAPDVAEHVQAIADAGVTLLRNQRNIVPLASNGAHCLITVTSLRISQQGQRFIQAFKARSPKVKIASIDTTMPLAAIEAEVGNTLRCTSIVIANFASITSVQKDLGHLLDKLIAGIPPVVLATFNDPYIGTRFPTVDVYLTPFSSATPSELSVVKALFGEIGFTGHSPVGIPQMAEMGAGIHIPARRVVAQKR
ncbi:MAG: glycoside hydrolase family 3 N-terminal domain-containing protein [Acidobacteriota bacterium]